MCSPSYSLQNMLWLGFVNRTQLPDLYRCLDVVLFASSTLYETFGIVNLVCARVRC